MINLKQSKLQKNSHQQANQIIKKVDTDALTRSAGNGIRLSFCINFNKLSALDKIVFLCIACFVRKLGRINPNAYFIDFVK